MSLNAGPKCDSLKDGLEGDNLNAGLKGRQIDSSGRSPEIRETVNESPGRAKEACNILFFRPSWARYPAVGYRGFPSLPSAARFTPGYLSFGLTGLDPDHVHVQDFRFVRAFA